MPEDAGARLLGRGEMSDAFETPRWYRSLYWRAAIAFFALFAILLVAEAALFLWFSAGMAGAMPENALQMARLVADDIGETLEADRKTDLEQHLRERYGHYFQTILVSTSEGQVVANHDDVDPQVIEDARERGDFRRRFGSRSGFSRGGPTGFGPGPLGPLGPGGTSGGDPFGPGAGPISRGPGPRSLRGGAIGGGGAPDGSGTGGGAFRPGANGQTDPPRGERRGGDVREPAIVPDFLGNRGPFDRGRRRRPLPAESAPIVSGGLPIGMVVIPEGTPPFRRILDVVGPTVGLVAGGVLATGGALIALVVFGPARRRLRQVQEATEQLGTGNLHARAPEHGGDEIATLARSFNHMADELTRRARALESSDRARRQLLADVSHELMTPLTAMRGYIETLGMTELALDAPTRERYMRIVSEETNRLETIIGDLLDLARLEGGGAAPRRELVSVEMLFNRVAERHERELTRRDIRLEQQVEDDADEVLGDGDRLEQALQNLVANALRYTPKGGWIRLTSARRPAPAAGLAKEGGDRSIITVHDSGPGIPETQLPLVFDRFYKGDASRHSDAGSGLGLSIVKAIVERHDGTITVRNDGGAVFEISLPFR